MWSPVAHRALITLETVLTHALIFPDSIALRSSAQLLLVSEEMQTELCSCFCAEGAMCYRRVLRENHVLNLLILKSPQNELF